MTLRLSAAAGRPVIGRNAMFEQQLGVTERRPAVAVTGLPGCPQFPALNTLFLTQTVSMGTRRRSVRSVWVGLLASETPGRMRGRGKYKTPSAASLLRRAAHSAWTATTAAAVFIVNAATELPPDKTRFAAPELGRKANSGGVTPAETTGCVLPAQLSRFWDQVSRNGLVTCSA